MRVLVTGAAGFIGAALSERLLARGDDVFGFDNMNAYYDVSLKEARLARLTPQTGFHFMKASLEDRAALEKAFAEFKPQRVVNLAAQAGVRYSIENPYAYVESNLVGFINLLEACRHSGGRTSRLCVIEFGVRRQPQAAVLGARCGRSSGEPVRGYQESQ